VPVEFDSAYERWGKAVHALVTANDRFAEGMRAAQSELDAAANEIDPKFPARG
jgi:hypothetical protein